MKMANINTVLGGYNKKAQWRDGRLCLLSVRHGDEEDRRLDKYYGPITLAFKKGKKRVLVKGKIKADFDSTKDGLRIDWYFVPKSQHKAKLLGVMKPTFESWKHDVDVCVQKLVGLGVDDLPDCCFYAWYEDGYTPLEAAKEAIQRADTD